MYLFKKFLDVVYGENLSSIEQDLINKFRSSNSFLLLTTQNYQKHKIGEGSIPTLDNIDDIFSVWMDSRVDKTKREDDLFSFLLLFSGWMIRHVFVEDDPRRLILLAMMNQYYLLMQSVLSEDDSVTFVAPTLEDTDRLKN